MSDTHYSENTLSAWAIEAVFVGARAVFRNAHIADCSHCAEKLRFFMAYYSTLKADLKLPPAQNAED